MKYLTSTDLAVWAQMLPAQSILPLLIRKLILATIDSEYIEFIEFPQGEDVQVGGYDGKLHLSKGNLYAPEKNSVWEFGVAKNVKTKADKDIEKRMADPLGKDPSCTTYIAVTLRKYTKKTQWAKARQKEGYWSDVRFYDAVDIEHWLDLAPAVEIWLARILKKTRRWNSGCHRLLRRVVYLWHDPNFSLLAD